MFIHHTVIAINPQRVNLDCFSHSQLRRVHTTNYVLFLFLLGFVRPHQYRCRVQSHRFPQFTCQLLKWLFGIFRIRFDIASNRKNTKKQSWCVRKKSAVTWRKFMCSRLFIERALSGPKLQTMMRCATSARAFKKHLNKKKMRFCIHYEKIWAIMNNLPSLLSLSSCDFCFDLVNYNHILQFDSDFILHNTHMHAFHSKMTLTRATNFIIGFTWKQHDMKCTCHSYYEDYKNPFLVMCALCSLKTEQITKNKNKKKHTHNDFRH